MVQPLAFLAGVIVASSLSAFAFSLVQSTSDSQVIYRCPTCRHAERCQRTEREAWSFRCNECERDYSTWGQTPIAVH